MARKEKRYHYIYKITCLINGRYYIGMHSTDDPEDGYMGGGKRIKNSVRKHGKDAHRKEILEFFENREDLVGREIQLVNEELLNDPMCMNLNLGGEGDIRWARESRRNGAINSNKINWKNPEFVKKMKETAGKTFERLWKDPDYRIRLSEGGRKSFKGRTHTKEVRNKISEITSASQKGEGNSQYGTAWIFNELTKETKKIKKEDLDYYLNSGWNRGRLNSK
jgi:hypothetical protein